MLFPASNRTVFTRNPLADVICQLRFPPILQIVAEEPAAFQNRVRDTYPDYEKDTGLPGVPEELKGMLAGLPLQLPGEGLVHRFLSEDHSKAIALAEAFVAVNDKAYVRWEGFRGQIDLAKSTTEAVYRPAFYSRVGLRYQNVIDRSLLDLHDIPWKELLRPQFAGVLAVPEVGGNVRQKAVQFLVELDEPPGSFATVRHGLQLRDESDDAYVIDIDFFTTTKMTGGETLDILDQFHEQAGHVFRWAITERLSNALGPEPVD